MCNMKNTTWDISNIQILCIYLIAQPPMALTDNHIGFVCQVIQNM